MALTKLALSTVKAGDPVTAQAWNTIVSGVSDLYDAVLAFGHGVLDVSVRFNGDPVSDAQVVAVPATGDLTPIEAVQLYGTVTTYTVVGVTAGQWHVFDGWVATVVTADSTFSLSENGDRPLVAAEKLLNAWRTAATIKKYRDVIQRRSPLVYVWRQCHDD